jgi:hypothetical protein
MTCMGAWSSHPTPNGSRPMYGLVDPFYEGCAAAIEPGHIWCDQPVYLPARHGLKIARVNPSDDSNLDYTVCGPTAEIFNHPPVQSLRMESSEGAVIAKTKRDRPVIVIGGTHAAEFSRTKGRASHAEIAMVVPIYGSDQYDEHVRRRMQIYDFTNVFYLPAHSALGFDEGFARLDHIQPIAQSHLSKHRGLKLAGEAFDALTEWLTAFLTGLKQTDSIIDEYRLMITDTAQE